MLIPIFDTTLVAISRKLSGRPLSQGGRDHTSHRLVALGVSERRAVLLLYILSAAAGVLALLVRDTRIEFVVALVAAFTMILFFIGLYLSKVRVAEDGDAGAAQQYCVRAMADSPAQVLLKLG
jgi:UDP-GlcNAc:undecaprenyl-phosphate GlcNAc-1-phosphate transferase